MRGPGVQIPPAPRRARGEMADAPDLGSGTSSVRVQVPPSPLESCHALVAQWPEHLTCNEVVVGSTPTEGSIFANFYLWQYDS